MAPSAPDGSPIFIPRAGETTRFRFFTSRFPSVPPSAIWWAGPWRRRRAGGRLFSGRGRLEALCWRWASWHYGSRRAARAIRRARTRRRPLDRWRASLDCAGTRLTCWSSRGMRPRPSPLGDLRALGSDVLAASPWDGARVGLVFLQPVPGFNRPFGHPPRRRGRHRLAKAPSFRLRPPAGGQFGRGLAGGLCRVHPGPTSPGPRRLSGRSSMFLRIFLIDGTGQYADSRDRSGRHPRLRHGGLHFRDPSFRGPVVLDVSDPAGSRISSATCGRRRFGRFRRRSPSARFFWIWLAVRPSLPVPAIHRGP